MSIQFACPQCKARIEVGDEFAGHAGQCPRCERVIAIPTGSQPAPVLETVEEPAREEPKPRRALEPRRPRKVSAAPKEPAGPIWPWAVGALGALIVLILLVSSFAVLAFWRKPVPATPLARPMNFKGPAIDKGRGVVVGRLDGNNRAVLDKGVFQIQAELNQADENDPDHLNSRCKIYQVQLLGDRAYTVEMDSKQLDCAVRVESFHNDDVLARGFNNGMGTARLDYQPFRADTYLIFATTRNGALGSFTLTIREQHLAKPLVP